MNYLLNGSLEHQSNISFDLKQIILKATQLDYKNRYNSVKEMDLAIQQKLVVIPPLNNDTFKSKMISLAWIVFTLIIVVDMEPGKTIKNSFINKLSCFCLYILVYSFTTTRIYSINTCLKYHGLYFIPSFSLYSYV